MDNAQKEGIKQILKRMPSYVKLIYRLYRDDRVPGSARNSLYLALGYNISPIDLIPGFIPLVGQIDNVYFTLKFLKKALEACPAEVSLKHLEKCGITVEMIEKDIETSKQLMKDIGGTVLKTSVKAIKSSASAVTKLGKGIFRPKKDK